MRDLAHIKAKERVWASGMALQFDSFFKNSRQEEVAKRSLRNTINSNGKPEQFRESWEAELQ
eukprot:11509630-Heterocapsa_arctica.AAC.1